MSTRSIVVDVNCGVSRVSWASSMYLKSEQKGKNRKDSILILGALGGKIHKTVTAKIF